MGDDATDADGVDTDVGGGGRRLRILDDDEGGCSPTMITMLLLICPKPTEKIGVDQ